MSDFSYVAQNLQAVLGAIIRESKLANQINVPRLVAVSKTFPAEAIIAAYNEGQRHFGENYIQELATKSEALKTQCPDIRWHYIGHIQSNKIKQLSKIPNLFYIETIESVKHAEILQSALNELDKTVNVFLQVNTSGEEGKGGVDMNKTVEIAKEIVKSASKINLAGLMTIGSINESQREDENADFIRLLNIRKEVASSLGRAEEDLELSMGMSSDYLVAIRSGSTNVRVGSSIFGNRTYKK
uniref:Pyridoxal phosphate homeostasis protein n=1 Tax=Panagrolaimus sp. PS1159 TaxID=55785 RepID=A0AC35F8I8_9BILA